MAKQERQIEFNSRQHKGRKAKQAELFMVKLLATQTFWTNYCVACFIEGDPIDYPKA
jgi:hypothetical protein